MRNGESLTPSGRRPENIEREIEQVLGPAADLSITDRRYWELLVKFSAEARDNWLVGPEDSWDRRGPEVT